MSNVIGKGVSRVDGKAKVTGAAKYAGEFNVPELTYGYVLSSAIAKGKIVSIDTSRAMALPGVLKVFTHENRPSTAKLDFSYNDQDAPPGSPFRPLYDAEIKFSAQPVALVVAETFELARFAATLVDITYEEADHETDLLLNLDKARKPKSGIASLLKPPPPKPKGDFKKAYNAAPNQVAATYVHAVEHHNPMEMFASTVVFEKDGKLTIYDKTQGVTNSKMYVTQVFGLSGDNVRIMSPYMGGGFGSGLRPQYQLFMATMAALDLKRSVRVTLTRQQMFTFGHRPNTIQHVAMAATDEGKINALFHDAIGETSQMEDYVETVVNWGGMLYPVKNVTLGHKLVPLDVNSPLDMRAPGGVTGIAALECAVDELAYKAGIDPLQFRLINYAERNELEDKPYSSKELRECFRQGAERFGWSERPLEPRSMKDGHNLIGWGMATGIWDANQMFASAEATLTVNGKLRIVCATADLGTGTYTIMTQIAAQTMGMPMEDVLFRLGDSDMPFSLISGGSWTAATVGSAVKKVCEELGKKLFKLAKKMPDSPFAKVKFDDVVFADSSMRLATDASVSVSLQTIVDQNGGRAVTESVTSLPNMLKQSKFARAAHSAVFVEVKVDEDLGTVSVTRAVTAVAAGRILNPKTARSQIIGGMVWGISKALEEETVLDHNIGRFMNHSLAEYHVAVNADIHDLDVIFVEEHDDIINPLGVKGVGEIGIVGMPAAVANAIFHATGKRINELPITLDKIIQ
ncbi:xanthine dehydrogenase family protein molybdopterin-binding subunit [Spirosoma sp. KUDC1026]|uniref:xanthine dehydrogenase family protein molybdopterin-binding subunit n=1 Tax=Spirosoma sp. KUDC1026 TaxID=2745947 RepID=UPI00159BE627|nr:xanthine dehydrogenase family protein molybdopterin-binding subunit [Spirosoma sp. KUDC1026]QKZ11194.1 xanthine dehydrogenase family protein molybdopterin-binding subunit [Spirosoma sp. KUDC1026]